jgi:hypothetical protein
MVSQRGRYSAYLSKDQATVQQTQYLRRLLGSRPYCHFIRNCRTGLTRRTHDKTLWPSIERFYNHTSAAKRGDIRRRSTWLLAHTTQNNGLGLYVWGGRSNPGIASSSEVACKKGWGGVGVEYGGVSLSIGCGCCWDLTCGGMADGAGESEACRCCWARANRGSRALLGSILREN